MPKPSQVLKVPIPTQVILITTQHVRYACCWTLQWEQWFGFWVSLASTYWIILLRGYVAQPGGLFNFWAPFHLNWIYFYPIDLLTQQTFSIPCSVTFTEARAATVTTCCNTAHKLKFIWKIWAQGFIKTLQIHQIFKPCSRRITYEMTLLNSLYLECSYST